MKCFKAIEVSTEELAQIILGELRRLYPHGVIDSVEVNFDGEEFYVVVQDTGNYQLRLDWGDADDDAPFTETEILGIDVLALLDQCLGFKETVVAIEIYSEEWAFWLSDSMTARGQIA